MLSLSLLLSVFRMIVLPVEFQDRAFSATPAQLSEAVRQAEVYFNRQYGGTTTFEFTLAEVTTLSHETAWYGANLPDRKDIHLADAVREACTQQQGNINFSLYDNDSDGFVDVVFLLTAGPGENDSGDESDIWPQNTRLSEQGGTLDIRGKRIDVFAACPEGLPGIFRHEFGHTLGLPDFYDLDGEDSGGRSPGRWGLSIMDEGCLKKTFPDFGALEYELLGLGRSEDLAPGHWQLEPLDKGRRYLKTGSEDEFFLFECRDGALYVSHVDRSDNPSGFDARQGREITARERWKLNAINNNPDHLCARLVPADPEARTAEGIPFAPGGRDRFSSDTPAPFRTWDGLPVGLALTLICSEADGSVSFDVIEPLRFAEFSIYQDAAVIRWKASDALLRISGYTISWSDGGEDGGTLELGPGEISGTLEGLQPKTGYNVTVQAHTADLGSFSVATRIVTKVYREGTYPYIYLNNTQRNLDGSFPSGSKIPLRVFNATQVQEIQWSLNGVRIAPEADGNYTLRQSGLLAARILHTDGNIETIYKEITVQ